MSLLTSSYLKNNTGRNQTLNLTTFVLGAQKCMRFQESLKQYKIKYLQRNIYRNTSDYTKKNLLVSVFTIRHRSIAFSQDLPHLSCSCLLKKYLKQKTVNTCSLWQRWIYWCTMITVDTASLYFFTLYNYKLQCLSSQIYSS